MTGLTQLMIRRGAGAGRRRCREELCRCGHPRSRHQLWLAVRGTRVRFIRGGGTCSCGRCRCERFRPTVCLRRR
jgi:hypothetical protein